MVALRSPCRLAQQTFPLQAATEDCTQEVSRTSRTSCMRWIIQEQPAWIKHFFLRFLEEENLVRISPQVPLCWFQTSHRMPKAPRHTPPRQDWRRYAETARKPRSAASLGDMMRQCNRDAWNKTYRAQVSSEYWEDECQEFFLHGSPAQNPVHQACRSHPYPASAGPDHGHVPVRPASPCLRQPQYSLLHSRMVCPDGSCRVGGAGQQQAVHILPAVPVRIGA